MDIHYFNMTSQTLILLYRTIFQGCTKLIETNTRYSSPENVEAVWLSHLSILCFDSYTFYIILSNVTVSVSVRTLFQTTNSSMRCFAS